MNLDKNILLRKLKSKILDNQKYINTENYLEDLEIEKYFIEKDILFKIREVELLQKYMILGEDDNPLIIQNIIDQVQNEFIDSEGLNKLSSNFKVKTLENLRECREVYVNIEYLLYKYLYDNETEFLDDLIKKTRSAYKVKDLKLLKIYEKIAKEKFNDYLSLGKINISTIQKSIDKVSEEIKTIDKNKDKSIKALNKDVGKLDKLNREIKEAFLLSVPDNKEEYLM